MNKNLLAQIIAGISLVVGVMVIVGWYLDITVLTSISPNWIRMKFATAVCFILSALIVFIFTLKKNEGAIIKQTLLAICPMLIILIMGTLFLGSVFGFQTGMENIAFLDRHEIATPFFQGRPAVPTMVNFILIAIIGFLYNFGISSKKTFLTIGAIVGGLGLIGLMGYIFNVPFLMYEIKGFSNAIAIHTTILFSLLGLALLFVAKDKTDDI